MASADRELSRIIKQAYLKRHKTSNLYAFIWPRNSKAERERNRENEREREGETRNRTMKANAKWQSTLHGDSSGNDPNMPLRCKAPLKFKFYEAH